MTHEKVYPGVPGCTWHESQSGREDVKDSEIIYSFDNDTWDDLFTNNPDFFVSQRLKEAFENEQVSGCGYTKISHAEHYDTGEKAAGDFFILTFGEKQNSDDVFHVNRNYLMLSPKAVAILKRFSHDWVSFGKPHDFAEILANLKKKS